MENSLEDDEAGTPTTHTTIVAKADVEEGGLQSPETDEAPSEGTTTTTTTSTTVAPAPAPTNGNNNNMQPSVPAQQQPETPQQQQQQAAESQSVYMLEHCVSALADEVLWRAIGRWKPSDVIRQFCAQHPACTMPVLSGLLLSYSIQFEVYWSGSGTSAPGIM